ncbi:MAG: MBL fold metallo-hydrolase [Acutalibacteraceae bacterium]|nr:MBL fold metallo-hydrolase [Clostridia bacterium]MEE1292052.1 MBL fold metallo-hydrolase [Acutalibacteraceae bacterium]MEE3373590.1 MBL fold metallo-hydrolase [Acutalibacteraceae bacterium]
MLPTNVYLGVNEETGNGFLVDPAVYEPQVEDVMKEIGIKNLQYILLTHGHFDHILGVNGFLKNHPEAKVVIHREDEAFLTDPVLSHTFKHGLTQEPIKADIIVEDGDVLAFDDTEFKVVHTPGHTRGSVVYLLDDLMFSGDTLFQLSCGRTDFPESDPAAMGPSLQKLAALEGNYHVLPGHNAFSELDYERANNPFMR